MTGSRRHAADLRGVSKLAVTATKSVTDIVEEMHRTIASGPMILGRPLSRPVRALLPVVYGCVRGVTDLVGHGIDAAIFELDRLLGESVPGPQRDAVVSVLNGVLGDYLKTSNNPLAITMSLRSDHEDLPLDAGDPRRALAEQLRSTPEERERIVVLIHGSAMNDRQWNHAGHDHGKALERDLGIFPVYARYNSGLHISENGRELSERLEALVNAWPVPVRELTLVGHSMGGLVARSACHAATQHQHTWRAELRRIVCIGSPHHGAPLERGGNLVDALLEFSTYSAPLAKLGQIRSAGVTDLRFGNVLDEDWNVRGRFARTRDLRRGLPLPADVECFAVAGTLSTETNEHVRSDGLVPVDSALGRCLRTEMILAFPTEHQFVALGTGHLELLSSQIVYARLREWLSADAAV